MRGRACGAFQVMHLYACTHFINKHDPDVIVRASSSSFFFFFFFITEQ